MRVCRRWKDIAVSVCELWSFLNIRCYQVSADRIMVRRGVLRGFTTWFSRAQARPLSMTLCLPRETRGNVKTEELDISAVLPRLWRLELRYRGCGPPISSGTYLPLLKCLTISLGDSELEAVLKHAPLLTELSWSRLSAGDLDFRWFTSSMLTKLELGRGDQKVSATQFISILENFPSLTDLSFCVDLQAFNTRPPLTFPNLQSLTLNYHFLQLRELNHGVPPIPPIRLLDLVTLPHLVRLHCTSPLRQDVLSAFISRSACAVRELECQFYDYDTVHRPFQSDVLESDIWGSLSLCPSVETLDITLESDITFFLEGIDTEKKKYSRAAPLLLPALQHLTITYSGTTACKTRINYSDIIDIVRRRREDTETPALKSLHIMIDESTEWDLYPGDTLAAEFHRLISGGLDFTIGSDKKVVWP
ncbi:hypothetical protein GGX14DRAFT_434214 [Mycena pura]|uniref:F-box domain-containing protein n=1 Tax=Mycena pura TaxID=153505 RepID=A0AAD6VU29_9AGAR|nr:hypothetical protein GGX14DRAFT_434214 [Mycena pura]